MHVLNFVAKLFFYLFYRWFRHSLKVSIKIYYASRFYFFSSGNSHYLAMPYQQHSLIMFIITMLKLQMKSISRLFQISFVRQRIVIPPTNIYFLLSDSLSFTTKGSPPLQRLKKAKILVYIHTNDLHSTAELLKRNKKKKKQIKLVKITDKKEGMKIWIYLSFRPAGIEYPLLPLIFGRPIVRAT